MGLKYHTDIEHSNVVEDFNCGFCGKNFTQRRYCQEHMKTCSENPNKEVFKCLYPGCDKQFCVRKMLNKHMRKEHDWGQ